MITAGVVRNILLVDIIALALLSLIYLRQRRMSWQAYCCWGLLAMLIPVLGPFLVISNRPGEWDPDFSLRSDLRRLVEWSRRLLPEPSHGRKLGALDKARLRRKRKRN